MTDYLYKHPKALQIVIGPIPSEKMLQVMAATHQYTGHHGRDVWYSTRTDTPLHAALRAGTPVKLRPVMYPHIQLLFERASAKFAGVSDLSETIANMLSIAFTSHKSTLNEPDCAMSMLCGMQLYAEFHQGRIELMTIDEETSINSVYKNGIGSLNPVNQAEWKVINEARAIAYGRIMRGIAPCPGCEPPSDFELDASTSVSDLLWMNNLKEDPKHLVPEVGAVIRGGPDFKKRGLSLRPTQRR